ncbi:MAG: phosphoserine transaminase [Actinobacteria bacterium]|uniref:phosphoserine transaminase n=1 Tax=freshwater metagenome TaxID=449393 RepID=A0A6J6TU39_9ZZZZ|nr:phosphoserine transaminase [Actinomycetota bacterium]
MAQIPEIKIPAELLPVDGRFGAGPSKIRSEQIQALVDKSLTVLGTSHRQKPVKNEVAALRAGLAELFSIPAGYEVVIGNGGTTAFWEIATFGLLRDRAQFLTFGEFGAKFASSAKAAPFLGEQSVNGGDAGDAPDFVAQPGIDAYCTPHNETSTGVAIPPVRPAGADADALVLIDATSGAGGLPVDLSQVDVYYFSPQKCFASDGGLFVAIMSPAAIARAEEIKASGRYIPAFLDLMTAIENSRLDQTYNTPAVATIVMMNEQIRWFNANGGLNWCVARTKESSDAIYDWAQASEFASPFVSDPAKRSQVVATVDFIESIDAEVIAKVLRANGIVDTEPYRKLGRNQLRISVFPAVDPSDVKQLLKSIDFVIAQLAN